MDCIYINQVKLDEASGQARFEQSFLNYLQETGTGLYYIGPASENNISFKKSFPINYNKELLGYLFYQINLFYKLILLIFKLKKSIPVYIRMHPLMLSPFLIFLFSKKYIVLRSGPIIPNLAYHNRTNSVIFRYIIKLICSIAYKRSDKIIVVTDKIKNWICNSFNISSDKIEVIPNGVNINKFDPDKYTGLKRKDKITFCLLGTLTKAQGAHLAIEAFSLINKDNIYNLDIIGGGDSSYLDYLKNMINEKKLAESVKLLGKVDHEEIPKYIYQRHIMLATFPIEEIEKSGSSALKLYEYMAMNRCIIAVDCNDHKFIAQNKLGYLYSPDNIKELSDKMLTAADNFNSLEDQNSIRKYCISNFASEKQFEKYLNIINNQPHA